MCLLASRRHPLLPEWCLTAGTCRPTLGYSVSDPSPAPVIVTSDPTLAPTMLITRVPSASPTEEPTVEPTALMTAYPTFVRPGLRPLDACGFRAHVP